MAEKKRHHYLPRFYLNGFIDPHNKPYIWLYEKGNPAIRKVSSKGIAVKKDYYSYITPNGKKDSKTFENTFEKIETKTAPIFRKIRNRSALTKHERASLAIFLALIMARVPNYRNNIEQAFGKAIKRISQMLASHSASFKATVKKFQKDTGCKIEIPIEDFRQTILNGQYAVKADPQFSLGLVGDVHHIASVASVFYSMNWSFLKATHDYKFVTSDNPLFYRDPTHDPNSPYGVGLLNKNIEVTFPISSELMFLGIWGEYKETMQLNNNLVKRANRGTVISALRFVYSSQNSNALNRFVQKYKNSAPKIEVR